MEHWGAKVIEFHFDLEGRADPTDGLRPTLAVRLDPVSPNTVRYGLRAT